MKSTVPSVRVELIGVYLIPGEEWGKLVSDLLRWESEALRDLKIAKIGGSTRLISETDADAKSDATSDDQ